MAMNNKIKLNDIVITPDGKGIVKKIEELYDGSIGYTCILEKPYKVINPWSNIRDYDYPSYSFGYMYKEHDITLYNNI